MLLYNFSLILFSVVLSYVPVPWYLSLLDYSTLRSELVPWRCHIGHLLLHPALLSSIGYQELTRNQFLLQQQGHLKQKVQKLLIAGHLVVQHLRYYITSHQPIQVLANIWNKMPTQYLECCLSFRIQKYWIYRVLCHLILLMNLGRHLGVVCLLSYAMKNEVTCLDSKYEKTVLNSVLRDTIWVSSEKTPLLTLCKIFTYSTGGCLLLDKPYFFSKSLWYISMFCPIFINLLDRN